MRVLWFTATPSMYTESSNTHNGGGWISSMEGLIKNEASINLAICFLMEEEPFKVEKGNCTYYPVAMATGLAHKIIYKASLKQRSKAELKRFLEVIADFKPDVIHIFGSEYNFGLIKEHTSVPVVIHIQGLLNPYYNAYFAPNTSLIAYFRNWQIWQGLKTYRNYRSLAYGAEREAKILYLSSHISGRTDWDFKITRMYAPRSHYFHINEVLRPVFYEKSARHNAKKTVNTGKIVIVSVLSKLTYKGIDVVMNTAALLKKFFEQEYEWRIYGMSAFTFWEQRLGIKAKDVNVKFMGVASSAELCEALIESDLFVHPSYIDNSPNSICEAQLLGVPVISTDVGGIRSLIDNGRTGLLVPANDPNYFASQIIHLYQHQELYLHMSQQAYEEAKLRHDRSSILADTLAMYRTMSGL